MRSARTSSARALLLVCCALQGCWGPHFDPEQPTLTPLQVREPIQGVVVTDFYQGEHALSQTQSLNIITLREAMSVRDVSLSIASILQAQGIPARAMSQVGTSVLGPGELLVRGVVNFEAGWRFHGVPSTIQFGVTLATLCIYGILLPYFYPVEIGPIATVRVDILDRAGNALLSTDERIHVYNRSFHLVAWDTGSDVPPASDELRQRLGLVIARALRSAGVRAPTGAAPASPAPAGPTTASAADGDVAAKAQAIQRGRTTKDDIRRAFGEPTQVAQVGAVERWTFIYPGAVGRAVVVDFDSSGTVCDHAYSEQAATQGGADFDSSRVRDLRTGVTTKDEVRRWFGEPHAVARVGAVERWTYTNVAEGRRPRVKSLVVDFDAAGALCDQGYSEQ